MIKFTDLMSRIFDSITVSDDKRKITFKQGKRIIEMYHDQDCCEDVHIDDISGDLEDLIGTPILFAMESTSRESFDPSKEYDAFLWTFYKLGTIKGYVDIRWVSISNGYYSERVDLYERLDK